MSVLVALTAEEPVVGALGLAGDGDVAGGFSFDILRVIPVAGDVADELEGVVVLGVVLRQVGSHLQRTPHHEVEGELADERRAHIRRVVAPGLELRLEDARGVVHRTALQTGEGQDDGVVGVAAAEGLILRAAGRLVADKVRPCAGDAGGACSLVGVDHDMVLGGFFDTVEVVVVHRLREVVVTTRDDVAHVTALHGVVAVFVHQIIRGLEVTLVVDDARRCFIVHHQLHALRVGVVVERLDVEVGIRRGEVEDIVLPVVGPVLPTDVPALDEDLGEAVGSGEVDVFAHLLVVGAVAAIGPHLTPIDLVEFDGRIVIGVVP